MTRTKYLKGECSECHGHLEFPAEATGMVIDCPHCGKPTELLLARPPEEPWLPRRTLIWTLVAMVIAGMGIAGMMVPLHLARKRMAQQQVEMAAKANAAKTNSVPPEPEDPATKAGFHVSNIRLEKAEGSSIMYATGTIRNISDRQRFGVRIELDLLDAEGKKIGTAKDYQQVIEPNGQWEFKALCVELKAASAKVAVIKEDQ